MATFEEAFSLLRTGARMTRAEWIQPFAPDDVPQYPYVVVLPKEAWVSNVEQASTGENDRSFERAIHFLDADLQPPQDQPPHLAKFTPSDSKWVIGWVPGQEDLFAADWTSF